MGGGASSSNAASQDRSAVEVMQALWAHDMRSVDRDLDLKQVTAPALMQAEPLNESCRPAPLMRNDSVLADSTAVAASPDSGALEFLNGDSR